MTIEKNSSDNSESKLYDSDDEYRNEHGDFLFDKFRTSNDTFIKK